MNSTNLFPALDPIPLPAPVWLFKVLHILTLSLHFTAVELLLGGLLVAVGLNYMGFRWRGGEKSALRLNLAGSLARRLPVVMIYVINLGVPPLLFAQVLYGRALYTSSVLIGVYWIGVVFLLMGCYWLLYQFSYRAQAGQTAWPMGLGAWLLAGSIAKIYSTNMTLMLRPEVWNSMYSASAIGVRLPPPDATLFPRWAFMMTGSLALTGLWMIWLAGHRHLDDPVRAQLSRIGGRLASVMAAVQIGVAFWVLSAQPKTVIAGLADTWFYHLSGIIWLAAAALIILVGAWASIAKSNPGSARWLALAVGWVGMLGAVIYRDGIRDLTLASKGFDVWQRDVVINGSVLGLFLVLFVAGLGALAWLISVMMRAKPVSEKVS